MSTEAASKLAVDPPDHASAAYVRATAALMAAQGVQGELARWHSGRLQEMKAGRQASTSVGEVKPRSCRYCGVSIVAGVTGRMRLERTRPGKRRRSRSNDSPSQSTTNRLQWTCQCGWQTSLGSSDPSTRRMMGRHTAVSPIESAPPPALAVLTTSHANTRLSDTEQHMPIPGIITSRPIVPVQLPSHTPVLPRKKRSKRENLQGMLKARRDVEEREKQTALSSGSGLAGFLQTL